MESEIDNLQKQIDVLNGNCEKLLSTLLNAQGRIAALENRFGTTSLGRGYFGEDSPQPVYVGGILQK